VATGAASIRYSLFAIRLLGGLSQLLALLDRLFDGADHVEGSFRQVVILAFAEGRGNPLMVSARSTNLPGEPVKISATWNGCDRKRSILRARATVSLSSSESSSMPRMAMMSWSDLLALEHLLDLTRGVVVLLTDDERREHARGRVERVHRRIDALFRDRCGSTPWSRPDARTRSRAPVGQVVGRNVDGLHRGDRTLLRGG